MLSVFFICVFRVWFGVFCRFFAVPLFLGSLFEKIFGGELLFLGGVVGLVFFGGFLPMFLLYFFGSSLPKVFGKNSLDVRSGVFWVRSLFLWFFRRRLFFAGSLLKRYRSGSNRTPPHAPFCLFLFSFFCAPPRFLFRPFWPCVLLFGVFLGVFLGFSLSLWGLSSPPSEALFLGRRAARVVGASLALFFFFPFCFVLQLHFF